MNLTRNDMETMALAEIVAALGQTYIYAIDDEALGVYSVARAAGGERWSWRCRGEAAVDGLPDCGLHIHKFPPDDGSRVWLEAVAQDACKMFYLIDAEVADPNGPVAGPEM